MITLTTDFGLKDPYVAEMKAVIYCVNPNAKIVDVTHYVDSFGIRMGAFVLASAAPFFPDGTVHVVVVDPGVGTSRRAIVVQTKRGFFVGPDNGVLMLAAEEQGIEYIYEISNPKFMLQQVSNTFHGRDIFAPVAGHLDMGVAPSEFGTEITDVVTPQFACVESRDGVLVGEVLHVDCFGNAITNFVRKDLAVAGSIKIAFHNVSLQLSLTKTYGDVGLREAVALFGSSGFLEVALNCGSFAEKYCINPGDKVEVAPD